MALSPSNPNIMVGSMQEFTSLISNANWTISSAVGTLGAGSTAYKKLFTATTVGISTLSVRGSKWGYLDPGLALQSDDSIIRTAGNAYYFSLVLVLNNIGDYLEWKTYSDQLRRAAAGFNSNKAMDWDMANYGQLVTYDNNTLTGQGFAPTSGDVLRYEIINVEGNKKLAAKKNGTIVYTHPETLVTGVNFGNCGFHYAYTTDIKIDFSFGGSGISGVSLESTTITVYSPPLITTTSPLPSAQIGNTYAQQLATSGGSGMGTWSIISNDPSCPVSLSSSGLVSLNASIIGTVNFTVCYTDSNSTFDYVNKAFTFNITPPPPIITNKTPLKYGQTGQTYSFQLQALGGSDSGTWSISVGSLGGGSVSAGGLITIPSVGSSNYTFTARYTDTNGSFVEQFFTIPVSEYAAMTFIYKRPLQIDYI